jgi:hypothetical protein
MYHCYAVFSKTTDDGWTLTKETCTFGILKSVGSIKSAEKVARKLLDGWVLAGWTIESVWIS